MISYLSEMIKPKNISTGDLTTGRGNQLIVSYFDSFEKPI